MALNWVGTPGAPVTTISLMPAALSPCRLAVAICTENQFMVNSELNVPDGWQPSLLLCIQSCPHDRVLSDLRASRSESGKAERAATCRHQRKSSESLHESTQWCWLSRHEDGAGHRTGTPSGLPIVKPCGPLSAAGRVRSGKEAPERRCGRAPDLPWRDPPSSGSLSRDAAGSGRHRTED